MSKVFDAMNAARKAFAALPEKAHGSKWNAIEKRLEKALIVAGMEKGRAYKTALSVRRQCEGKK